MQICGNVQSWLLTLWSSDDISPFFEPADKKRGDVFAIFLDSDNCAKMLLTNLFTDCWKKFAFIRNVLYIKGDHRSNQK